uniref:Uncharacterized protein n=1 Tax=Cucumis melo TaxID=3656 RepID=A0A9I9E1I6_CUCME
MNASRLLERFGIYSLQRETTCWEESYANWPLNCNYIGNLSANLSANTFCSPKAENGSNSFDFGIFKNALCIVGSRKIVNFEKHVCLTFEHRARVCDCVCYLNILNMLK